MKLLSIAHLIYLLCTTLFFIGGCFLSRKLNRTGQNILFGIITFLCCSGIFFRYAMNLGFKTFTPLTLAKQLLQVCTFNFVLLPLMLIPKFELARQYSIFFSMFAAMTSLLSIPSSWANYNPLDITIFNSWCNHTFAIALPLFMIASGRTKPKKAYIWKVLLCVFAYFTINAGISKILINKGIFTIKNSLSYIFTTDGIFIFEILYKIIPIPYFYLYQLIPLLILFFFALSWAFRKYEVKEF